MSLTANELLLPQTDAGAGVQVLVAIVLTAVIALSVRRERPLVLLTIGVGMVVLGTMGLRALH